MFKHKAFTLEGSVLAEQAVPNALALSQKLEAELILPTATSPLTKTDPESFASLAAIESSEKELNGHVHPESNGLRIIHLNIGA
jgi:hypothetical protein